MNVAEFAERVLFGTTLGDKLAPAACVNDFTPRSPVNVDSLPSPGRDISIRMHHGPGAAQAPADADLEKEEARGRLLHFLANHELLATELMALVLLKFPDAPDAFRRGVFVTLQEEQEHTRLYLERMQECGIPFGSQPLSGHFWRVVEPMRTPMDFVSRLSLTFEQANLDYSLHYARVFSQIDDKKTAAVLNKIYKDEISHVRHGLNWFRQWKAPQQSDWDAYQTQLQYPMSPQRAKGSNCVFNRAGREEVGLDTQFIDAVEVFRQSRGRPPNVYWFDAAAEVELASSSVSGNQTKLMQQLNTDLEYLPMWLAQQDDVVLVQEQPTQCFQRNILQASKHLPEFVTREAASKLRDRQLGRLQPWAWTPGAAALASELFENNEARDSAWNTSQRDLFRKSWTTNHLRTWLAEANRPSTFFDSTCVGLAVRSISELRQALIQFSEHGFDHAIAKADIATAGRGQRRLSHSGLQHDDQAWLEARSQQIVVEPKLDRVLDLSFQWHLDPATNHCKFLGWTRQIITAGRRYAGTYLREPFSSCDADLRRFVLQDGMALLHLVRDWLSSRIVPELLSRRFRGYFGVDTLIARDQDGDFRLKPIVELNPRTTMGHIALQLESRVSPSTRGIFRILTNSEWNKIKPKIAAQPMSVTKDGRWKDGALVLSHPDENSRLIPAVLVGSAIGHSGAVL